MRNAGLFAAGALMAALLFLLVPGIDLAVSRLFYAAGQGFPLAGSAPLRFIEETIPWLTRLIIAVAAVGVAWLALIGRPLWRLDRKALVFLVAATAIGPGLIANTLLKDNWGRARPYQVEQFGGARQFTAAPLPASECERNCAFVSGHAALGFGLISFALLLPAGKRRRLAVAGAVGFGALVGLARIAVGHHFLSDVVYAGLIVTGSSWLLYQALVARDLLARPAAVRYGRAVAAWAVDAWEAGRELSRLPAGRIALWMVAVAVVEAAAMLWVDRPLALFFLRNASWRPTAELVQRLGYGTPYLVGFSLGFVLLRWGGGLPRLRQWNERMRAAAIVPLFLLAAIVASGLTVDLLKVVFGRARPKLLYADGTFDFGWLGLAADHWSFPSGHAATIAALMTALWCLWPRHVLFYAAFAALVGFSRVVTGAHYLSDVVMGAFVAVLITRALAVWLARFGLQLPLRRSLPEPALRLP